ncbi:hypothetical protein KC946_03945 [Candidatus Saccharibacteria bacterium]|nr:hypothetical protein [Candidatus Saccharibacteria bacterium]
MKTISIKLKRITVLLVSALVLTGTVPAPVFAANSAKDAVCQGAGVGNAGASGCAAPVGSPTVNDLIKTGLNIFSAIVGIIAVVMVMLAGVKYMMSQGEAGKINEAKNALLYAVVGIVIVAMAQVIVNFVISRFS